MGEAMIVLVHEGVSGVDGQPPGGRGAPYAVRVSNLAGVGPGLAPSGLGCAPPVTCENGRWRRLLGRRSVPPKRGVCKRVASVLVRALSEGVGFRCTR